MSKNKRSRLLRDAEYVALAEFRYHLRKFQRHMQEQVRGLGVNPQQYQLVLAVKGLPAGQAPTIGVLAERMQLNHNSTVELVDRCERRGLLRRERGGADRRQVALSITSRGERLLRKLGLAARAELMDSGFSLVDAVHQLTLGSANSHRRGASKKPRA
jgi:DNA-binding MarR family transcriptional regulator